MVDGLDWVVKRWVAPVSRNRYLFDRDLQFVWTPIRLFCLRGLLWYELGVQETPAGLSSRTMEAGPGKSQMGGGFGFFRCVLAHLLSD